MMDPIRIFFAGDFCSKPSTSKINVSKELKDLIQSCDLKVVNFEVPLKPDIELPERKEERFFQNDDTPEFLRSLGFDLFSIANNHIYDWGEEGYKKTKEALGDAAFGAGDYNEAYQVKEVEIKGIKIGFLALSYFIIIQDIDRSEETSCAYINDLKVNHVIIEAKKRLDFLFIICHDGIEYVDAPMPETIARYRDLIDYGADGIVGSHPHCPQGWEEYKGKPIFYSLGNFFFNSKEDTLYRATNRAHWYEGRCVVLSVEDKQLSWEVINTRNIDNIAIEIDHDEKSISHNEYICNLISNKDLYKDYVLPIMKKEALYDLTKMESLFQPKTIKQSLKSLYKSLFQQIRGEKIKSRDKELLYIFRNDLRRSRLLRMLLEKM